MFNKFLINIKGKENWESRAPYLILNKDFFIPIFIVIFYIGSEYLISNYLIKSYSNALIQALHIFFFFFYFSFTFLKSFLKSLVFCLLIFITIIPLYYFIEIKSVSPYFSSLFLIVWGFIFLFFKNKKNKLKKILVGYGNFGKGFWWAILGGLFFCAHIFLVLWFSHNIILTNIDLQKIFVYLMLEISFSLLGMEFLIRYFLFLRLIQKNNFSFILASLISSFFSVGIFLLNVNLNKDIAFVIGTAFYTFMQNTVSCWIAYKTKSVAPSIVFGLIISIFLAIIFVR